jgi:phosphatidylglycerophosphate synthase
MPAGSLGKGKTLATLVGIELVLLSFDAASGGPLSSLGAGAEAALYNVGYWVLIAATALSVVSGWEYIRAALPVLTGHETGERPPAT